MLKDAIINTKHPWYFDRPQEDGSSYLFRELDLLIWNQFITTPWCSCENVKTFPLSTDWPIVPVVEQTKGYNVLGPMQWRIQDFPEVGAPTLRGGTNIHFAKFSQKLHGIERILTPGGARPSRPRWPATAMASPITWWKHSITLTRFGIIII